MFCYNCALDATKYTFETENEKFGLSPANCRLEMTFVDNSVAVEYIAGKVDDVFRKSWAPTEGYSHCKVFTSLTMIDNFEIIGGIGEVWINKCSMYEGMNPMWASSLFLVDIFTFSLNEFL